MTRPCSKHSGARAHVSEQTRAIHEELHENPVLSRLTDPAITWGEYQSALRVLQRFYNAVERERARLALWDAFSLSAECDALKDDLPSPRGRPLPLQLANPAALLGGLYVAHGASFGRAQFHKTVSSHLPHAPRAFVARRTDKATWRQLTACMEHVGQSARGRAALLNGAELSFLAVRSATQDIEPACGLSA